MSNESSQFKVINATQNVLLNVQRQLFHKLCKGIADDPWPCVHKWFEESVPALRVPRKNDAARAAGAFGRSFTVTT